jgi:hypothetical protein
LKWLLLILLLAVGTVLTGTAIGDSLRVNQKLVKLNSDKEITVLESMKAILFSDILFLRGN